MNLTYSYMLAHVIMSENNGDSTFSFSTCSLLFWFSHPGPLNLCQLLLIPDSHWDSFTLDMNFFLGKVIINLKSFLLQPFLAFLLGMGLDKNYKHCWLYKTSVWVCFSFPVIFLYIINFVFIHIHSPFQLSLVLS